ncbi:MAG: uvrA, partial [Deltaproteobacteria bacterium]|nr:uvrA [Deltaproteobacteria bacterium]
YRGVKRIKGDPQGEPGRHSSISGTEAIEDVLLVDQKPIGRSPRANPLTYLKAMDPIRQLLAGTEAAREKGMGPRYFSFNVADGRCPTCQGAGFEKVEMQFLSDVFITCPDCGGKRFTKEVLEVRYRDKNMDDILSMTVTEAIAFFREQRSMGEALQPLVDVGLGYMRLGQPINTLSGGEAQRLKLCSFLKTRWVKPRLFIFDEPTTGLHFEDIQKLLSVLQRLVDQGHTVLVIEHNMDVVKTADWVIDLGPEGGEQGGALLVAGPPEKVAAHKRSHTASFLKNYLSQASRLKAFLPARVPSAPPQVPSVLVRGAREHNLKDLTVSIPRQELVVVTGISGSGKSTLLFDILFAEGQRIRLAAQLGSNLTGVSYILDEPTIGLHARDNRILLDALKELKNRGNSIFVVEHDEETIREADHVIDLGPGAGREGGQVVASGKLADLKKNPSSITGISFNGKPHELTSRLRPYRERPALKVISATEHNLKGVEAAFPLGTLLCVTGVSGSGKSTLLKETLYKGLQNLLLQRQDPAGACVRVEGWEEALERVLEVDHSPIGYTPRSVPSSYVGFLPEIRHLLSMTPEARARGYRPGRFSFNLAGGRCEACKGHGAVKVEMSFLPDVYVNCEVCHGKRFNQETLDITYRGKNIAEILDLTFEEAKDFFVAIPRIRHAADVVCRIGLGYLRIGQSSPTLSGGEAQRIKLAEELAKPSRGRTLYILDEPTTGLHLNDVKKLVDVLQALVDQGNTVALIEHNMEMIKEADYIIDLGPEGGEAGGFVVATGSPVELLASPNGSHTVKYLKKYLER